MNAGQRTGLRWRQTRNTRRIKWASSMASPPPGNPQRSLRAGRSSFKGSDGTRSRKSGARACRCGQSNGSWGSTGPPSGDIWKPEDLRNGARGRFPFRQHRIPWQHSRVTFSLNTYPDIFPDLRHLKPTIEPPTWPNLPPPFTFRPLGGLRCAPGVPVSAPRGG